MNEIACKFLLNEDKFIPALHLRQQGFTYRPCEPFIERHESVPKYKETGILNYIYKRESDKACFARDDVHGDSKGLPKKAVSDQDLSKKSYKIAPNPKFDGYQKELVSMMHKLSDKKVGYRVNVNEVLLQELHKPKFKKFKRRKLYASPKDNFWAVS